MSVETKVKTIESDSSSFYRVQRVKFNSDKSVTTPTKTIPLDKLKLKQPLNEKALQINEIFRRFNADSIKKNNEDGHKYGELESWFKTQKKKAKEDTVTISFVDFDEPRLPTEEEIEFMTDLSYCYSDITPIPTINQMNQKKVSIAFDDYLKYLKRGIGVIERLNKKPIMGVIPKIAPKNINALIGFYKDRGINSFAFDFGGSNPISQSSKLFKVIKALKKLKILETSYVHGHNVGVRVNKATDVIPARDILGFGIGLSSLGEKRVPFRPNPAFISMIKLNPLNKFRLFNKKDYGYWKAVSAEDLPAIFPEDCRLPIEDFKNSKKPFDLQKVFNAEQLALEAHNIRSVIKEESDKALTYVKKKKYVEDSDIRLLETAQKRIR